MMATTAAKEAGPSGTASLVLFGHRIPEVEEKMQLERL